MKFQIFLLLLLVNGMMNNQLPDNENGEIAVNFNNVPNDSQSNNSNDVNDEMRRRQRLSEFDYLTNVIERSDLAINKNKILLKEDNENDGVFKEIKSISSEIIVTISDNVAILTGLIGWNIYGMTCSPVWGGESGLPNTDDFLCNVQLYVLDLRKTIFIVLLFSMFRAVANSFFKSHIEDRNVEKSHETRKYYNSLESLVDQKNNTWKSLNGFQLRKPSTWRNIKPVYVSIQLQAILRLIGMRIICQYYIYALWAAVWSSSNWYSYSTLYTYATLGSIIQLVLEIILEIMGQCACSSKNKCVQGFGNGLRYINYFLAIPNKVVSLICQKHLGTPGEMLYNQYETLITSHGGLSGQTDLLSDKTRQEIRERYGVDHDIVEWFLSCRWLKTLGHNIEDSYFGFVIVHALHANTMDWRYWIGLFMLNFAYVAVKDKERVWYMRFLNQLTYGLAYGYYSVNTKNLPKTLIALMVPGQMVRAVIASFWNWNLFTTNVQDFYGDLLNNNTGEGIFHNIFNGLSRPADSTFGLVKNSLIVMVGVFSIMGMIFPDPQTPIDRLMSRFYFISKPYRKFLFYLYSGLLVILSYLLFLCVTFAKIFGDPNDGMANDTNYLRFIVLYQMASLVMIGLVKIWNFEETQNVIKLFNCCWTTQGKKKPLVNDIEFENQLQESLVNQNQFKQNSPAKN